MEKVWRDEGFEKEYGSNAMRVNITCSTLHFYEKELQTFVLW